jgi:hypothetical protein
MGLLSMRTATPRRGRTLSAAGAGWARDRPSLRFRYTRSAGVTLIEMLISLSIAALLIVSLTGVVNTALEIGEDTTGRNRLAGDANFAVQRMVRALSRTRRLAIPMADNPATAWSESDRDVLAVTLDPFLDRDADGIMDADNDSDGLIDEDPGYDNYNNDEAGIILIDDDGDGLVDEHAPDDGTPGWNSTWYKFNNDEDLAWNEELLNRVDDDGDGLVDEDLCADMDTNWTEALESYYDLDDDGDGSDDEDWYDVVVYHLVGSTLYERMPNLNPSDGADYSERVIAEDVTQFRVVRVPPRNGTTVLVEITLALGDPASGVTVRTRVRVGADL